MSYLPGIPDHPDIQKMERDGTLHPEELEDEEPICPVCGEACATAFTGGGEVLGCENCVTRRDAWDDIRFLPRQLARKEAMGW